MNEENDGILDAVDVIQVPIGKETEGDVMKAIETMKLGKSAGFFRGCY